MRIPKKFYIGAASLLVAVGALVALNVTGTSSQAVTMGDRRDCGYTDVIINCGATSTTELLQKYDSNNDGRGNRDIQAIFNHYGIQRTDIAGTTSEVKRGWLNTNGVVSVDGKTVATNAKSLYRVDPGKEVSPVSISGKTYYIGPVANNYSLGADVFVFFKNGKFHAAIQSSCGNPIVATPKPEEPKPAYACESLKATKISRTNYRFTTTASATNGAQIVSYNYDFGDGTKTTGGATIEHNYAQAGNYTITVTVNVKVDGKTIVVPGANCKTTIKVEEEPKVPVYKCESLKATKLNSMSYRFTADASASNGAVIESYTYTFGDGKSTTSADTTIEHTYATFGTYTATLSVKVIADGKTETVTGPNCKVTIEIKEIPVEPAYACESLKATKISRDTYRFTADASASNGAVIEDYTYDFGDGKSTTSANTSVENTYAAPGTYTATVSVNVIVDGKTETVTGPACKVTITVDEEEVEDEPSIDIVKTVNGKEHVKVNVNSEFTYEITVRNTGNVVLKNAVVTDKAPSEVTLISSSIGTVANNEWKHTIAELEVSESISFTIKAKYAKYASGTHKNTVCVDTPTVPGSPDDCDDATTETKELIEVCDLSDNTVKTIERSEFDETTMTTDMSKCEDAPVSPPELPKTGLDMFVGGSLGLGSISAAGYYWSASRRNLLNALLNK